MAKTNLSAERLRELLHYDPETGVFTWRVNRWRLRAGDQAGFVTVRGRVLIRVDQYAHKAHRLAWFYVHGEWPEKGIDHIDGNPANNRIANLRLTNQSENLQNQRRPHKGNASGYLGVSWVKDRGKWEAKIKHDGRTVHLGRFAAPEDAYAAYLTAKRKYHKFCAI